MSAVATAAKTTKSTPPAAVATAVEPAPAAAKPEVKIREVQPFTFAPSSLQELGYSHVQLSVVVPAGKTFKEAIAPHAWTKVASIVSKDALGRQQDKIGSFIWIDSADGRFLALTRINGIVRDHLKQPCGLDLICVGPAFDVKTGKCCPVDPKTGTAYTGE